MGKLFNNLLKISHPFLFSIFPIVFLLAENKKEFDIRLELLANQVLMPFLIIILGTIFLLSIGMWIFRNYQKSAMFTSSFLILFFSYGRICDLIKEKTGLSFGFVYYLSALIVLLAAYIVAILYLRKTRREMKHTNTFLNIVAIVLVLYSFTQVLAYKLSNGKNGGELTQSGSSQAIPKDKLPDIYYIILDGYASSSTLKDDYGFDNKDFYHSLDNLGFYVASDSHSNYPLTRLSLAATLNMEYLDDPKDKAGVESQDYNVFNQKILDNKVASTLKAKGYKFINFGSGWDGTDTNPNADVNISTSYGGEFQMVLIHSTILRIFESHWFGPPERRIILNDFSELEKINQMEGPTFSFAHIICPHPPYVFDENGDPVNNSTPEMDGGVWKQKDNYLNQVKYLNKKVVPLVTQIISKSKTPPIIIIQSDHGSESTFKSDNKWDNPNETNIKERMGILNAIFVPKDKQNQLYESISSVNTFRYIFKNIFNEDYNLLPDKSFFLSNNTPQEFVDVTNIVQPK